MDGEADGNGSSSGNELERLIGISERLGELNRTLRSELDDSRKSSAGFALGGVIMGVVGMSQ
ncbi:hypothetical protein AGMMS50268_40730 [Spirochaetia bacterium]|nr:hypothetical protein AGMMS50268_40730 [Spirochaetia bacterium]